MNYESRGDAERSKHGHQYGSRCKVLYDTDARVGMGMQMVDQMFHGRVKKLRHDDRRARDCRQSPPDWFGPKYAQYDDDAGKGGGLESQAMLGSNGFAQPREGKGQTLEKRLIFV
jgi:hypothetical protein